MAKTEKDSGLFVALNFFSHLTLCLSKKMRHCFKSSNIFKKTSDFFHALTVTDFTTLESGILNMSVLQCLEPPKKFSDVVLGFDIAEQDFGYEVLSSERLRTKYLPPPSQRIRFCAVLGGVGQNQCT